MDNKQATAEWIAQQRKLWDEDSLARFVLDAKAAIPELADALEASIQREAEKDAIIARVTAERDAAVKDIVIAVEQGKCHVCKHRHGAGNICQKWPDRRCFEWREACQENTEEGNNNA